MSTNIQVLDLLAPEFSAVDTTIKTDFITQAAAQLSPVVWGSKYQMGLVRLAAHWLTLRARALAGSGGGGGGSAGPVKREKAGDLEIEYASSASSTAAGSYSTSPYGTTSHGMEYLVLRAELPRASAYVVTG